MRQSPLRGTIFRWLYRTNPQLRCFAACSGFHDIGPAPRNLQLILNLIAFVGAWLRRDAIAFWVCISLGAYYPDSYVVSVHACNNC